MASSDTIVVSTNSTRSSATPKIGMINAVTKSAVWVTREGVEPIQRVAISALRSSCILLLFFGGDFFTYYL